MDYGRLAYIKTEELEGELKRQAAQTAKRNVLSACYHPRAEIAGGYSPCVVSGDGSVGLTVSVALRAPAGADGVKASLYCGGKLAAYVRVTLGAGETGRYTLLACVYPSAGEALEIRTDGEGLILEEFSLLTEGSGANITGGAAAVRSDFTAGKVYTARCENGYVYIYDRNGKKANAAHSGVFDISAANGNVYAVCADDVGNLWGVRYDGELNETARVYLGDAPEKVALGLNPYGLTVAGSFGGEVRFFECADDFSGRSDWAREDVGTLADDIYFCKQSTNPALFIKRDGRIYAKLPVPFLGSREHVAANITLGFED